MAVGIIDGMSALGREGTFVHWSSLVPSHAEMPGPNPTWT
jgi:hypothetical protein